MSFKIADITIPMPWGHISGRTFGDERATPVLCIHGRSDNLETFTHLLPLLPHHHFYVCCDLPGHGKSSHADIGYILDLMWYTLCVKRIVDHFKWPRFYFLGHSLGGQIGFLLAALYPELVAKLIIIDTLMFSHTAPSNTSSSLRNLLFESLLKLERRLTPDQAPTYSLTEFVQKMKEARKTNINEEQIMAMAERNLARIGPDQYKYSNDQRTKLLGPVHFTFDQLESLANNVHCPTLLILGKNSRVTKPLNRLSYSPLSKNTNVTSKIIEGDHDVHLTNSQQVAQLIVPFLSEKNISKL